MKNTNTWYSILWIFSPIILGLGSSALLHLFSFKTPTKWAELSEKRCTDFASSMRKGVIPKNQIPRVRSKWNPPGWVFGIVWPVLYLLLGYSSYLVWKDTDKTGEKEIDNILEKYIIHFVLLLLWWPYFVYFPNAGFATISLLLLAISAVYIGWNFYKINKTAGLCWFPYTIWLFFATFLTSQTIYTKD
jgi:tryptophan-rich sensory protein